MKGNEFKRVAILLPLVALLALGGYRFYQAVQERNALREQTARDATRMDLLEHKYKEKKAVEANLMRKTLMLQGKLSKATSERNKLQEAHEEQVAAITAQLEGKAKRCGRELSRLNRAHTVLKAEKRQLVQSLKETRGELETVENERANLEKQLMQTSSTLERTQRSHRRCGKHNLQLSIMVEELIRNYSEKGFVESLAVAEPFTQLKQVEMERIVQEYTDRLEKHQYEMRDVNPSQYE